MNPKPTAREEYLEARVEALVRALEEAKDVALWVASWYTEIETHPDRDMAFAQLRDMCRDDIEAAVASYR